MEQIINKTLDLVNLRKESYISIIKEINALILHLNAKSLKFTTYQAEFDTGWGEGNIWFKRKLWEICTMIIYSGVKEGQRVLDCGGASSIFSFYLASKRCIVYTIDIDWRKYGIVTNANKVAEAMDWNMNNQEGSITELPFKDETFDKVFSICVLEHLSYNDQIKAIKEMARVLKLNGIIGLTFDYGPAAFGEKYSDVNDINNRVIIPSGLKIMGNRDYQENAWFGEQAGKTWGSLFLKKTNEISGIEKNLLVCTSPKNRAKVKIIIFLKALKDKIKMWLCKIGIRRSNKLYLTLTRLFYKSGFIKLKNPKKLHLGCGGRILSAWTNIDIYGGDIRLDILKGLPFKNNSVDFIYHAHFIEHFTIEQNLRIFNECYRVLNENGVLRILFPDLVKHCQIYLNNDLEILYKYKDKGIIAFEPEKFKYSPLTEWFNKGFYDFGHKFIYDFKTIETIAKKAGFTKVYLVKHGQSAYKDLVGIDYYPNSDALFSVVEIRK